MTLERTTSNDALTRLRWPLLLTRWGMVAERVTRAFWPFWSVVLLVLAALMLGLHESLPLEIVWGGFVVAVLAALGSLYWGIRRFHWPHADEAMDRLDRTLPGRPITALADTQAIGGEDAASQAVWKAHLARMAERAASARAVEPDLRISARDPYALRYVAVLFFAVALLFGSFLRVTTVTEMTPGLGGTGAVAAGPSWEGWIEPPAYTGKPSLYLNDIPPGDFAVPEASRVTLRLYGDAGDLTVAETVSGRTEGLQSAADPSQTFEIHQPGTIRIDGPGGAEWKVDVIGDTPPVVAALGEPERGLGGEMRQNFRVEDDYGVRLGRAEISLDLDAVDRRYGLAMEPEQREMIVLDLPMTISGDRANFEEVLIENLSEHPWAMLPVKLELFAEDDLGQTGQSEPNHVVLPGRRFFDPLANAIVEMRRDLLWNRENGPRIAQVLRAISHRADEVFDSETAYLKLRFALRRLELFNDYGITDEQQAELAQVLWDIATLIEDGNLTGALERLREARERLEEAMRNGATDEEIAELMRELREAMNDYMRQLAEQQRQDGQQQAEQQGDMREITGDQLEALMERLQQLMEEGRMDEAMELMERLAELMENMQVAEGEGQPSPGQQAMDGLADTLRQQQDLSDETFGDLQEQFGQQGGGQQGQGQQMPPGQGGNQGQGQQPGQGQGQQGQMGPQGGPGDLDADTLAERQRSLREELGRQQGNLPGAGTPEGDAARDALGRAGRAMDDAEDALREDDLAGALDSQSEAIEALRDGMRELGDMMAQNQQNQGQQGEAQGQANNSQARDPLGREPGSNGQIGTEEEMLQGDDVYRRARELLDEIRRRSSDQTRPDGELDYLRRLLDRF
ncbi:TIGR02302 family protein [Pseudoruegeria sp. HB172150]|uniref:TIGR02302 family protein n=1 Tax=Pseudoruegeria sp. HB172150 TaxID=2721164 RepID=UPI0020A63882|nr:TIGR02302 family protein [Pseudoruegeria sp. HB172150]